MITELGGDDVSQQPRPGQTLFNRLRCLGGGLDVRFAIALVASVAAGTAGIFMADVLEHFQTGGIKLQLLADLTADADAILPAAGTLLLFVAQVMNNLHSRQMIRQLASAVLVMIDSPGLELLPTLGLHGLFIHRQFVDGDAEQQQLGWIKPLRVRAVEAANDRIHLRLVPLGHRFKLIGGFTLDLIELRVSLRNHTLTLRDEILMLENNPLEQHRIIRQIEDRSGIIHDVMDYSRCPPADR